jgi:hypothetical protein
MLVLAAVRFSSIRTAPEADAVLILSFPLSISAMPAT